MVTSRWPASRRPARVSACSTPRTTFGIFEPFSHIVSRHTHVVGEVDVIFRDNTRMNDILAYPADLHRMAALFGKKVFGEYSRF